jgi:hypothetical protein
MITIIVHDPTAESAHGKPQTLTNSPQHSQNRVASVVPGGILNEDERFLLKLPRYVATSKVKRTPSIECAAHARDKLGGLDA